MSRMHAARLIWYGYPYCFHIWAMLAQTSFAKTGLERLWGTPVFARYDERALKASSKIALYLERMRATEPVELRSSIGGWQSRDKKFLEWDHHPTANGVRKRIRVMRERIDAALQAYLSGLLNASSARRFEARIETSWANVNPPNSINGPHVHPFSAISGAYYLTCGGNATLPCTISLSDPRPAAPMSHFPKEIREALDFGIDWKLTISPGTVLLFPAWLSHWVPPNTGSLSRMSISFNANIYTVQ
eukprot:gnl/MRDRNA2_/MRDRNA2_158729_c0_seq1.p1 gnl/MRDRNA2_/MRDRNA2_158729_c0~~gnl/MRDRNA2_/MRDRNA2_158729_c0_seq1.p1  ORF type:complete len:246 (+),score=34.25 gnl/MRDRNA2_/MRDRNA2_158729_c0_seq1:150-887(+)